jgi:hypothetical protein
LLRESGGLRCANPPYWFIGAPRSHSIACASQR